MNVRYLTLLLTLFCLSAVPGLTQTTIGGGACTSATLTGPYQFTLNGRQVTSSGSVSKLLQGVGTANFDGLSAVTLTVTANIANGSQSFGTPLVYSGSYSLQSNCAGTISITSGDTATFTVEAYAQGNTFAVIGSDATYAYNGSGNSLPASCPTTLSGVHEFNANGNTLSGASVTGVLDVAGVLQFNGQGGVTANWVQISNLVATNITATGTYTLSSNCQATATLTDASSNKYSVFLSIYTTSPAFALAVSSPQSVFDGTGAATQATLSAGCAASTLNGTYELVLSGRLAPGGVVTKILASNGVATFDGVSKVTFSVTSNAVNGTQAFGVPLTYSGAYSLQSNCQGAISITGGDVATLSLVAYALDAATQEAHSFTMVGTDATYAYNGSGTVQPTGGCAVSTLSGEWPFSAPGNSLSGSTNTGVLDIAGVLQFDGQGNATANWTQASNTASANVSATGTYTLTSGCVGSLTLTDTAANKYVGAVSVNGANAGNFGLVAASPQLILTGAGHSAFVNPGQAVVNAASFTASQTPAGSVFSIFGSNLATKVGEATNVPLPTTLLTTTVTVNGELAPLFYADPNQINAQMPEDIKPGVATVVVKNGSSASNAAAVVIPAAGTPGIVVYGNNRAVVVNVNGSVNSPTSPAKVGDTVTAYFTGGGPVNASGTLVTGAPTPAGLSPVSGPNTVTAGGTNATVTYMGLTPGSIGLYQVDFVVPKVTTADHPLVITISGQASNNPLIAVTN